MGLFRLLFLFAIGWLIWRLVMRAAVSSPSMQAPPRTDTGGRETDYLPLTKCATCGAHIPQPPDNAAPICERCRSR